MSNHEVAERKPKLSVVMITYNHENYIEQAVRSVMMQETDFDYELVIGEDCSTDSTREIILRLKEEFPDKIRLLLHPQNIGMIPNMVSTYNTCRGKYIALCEGDDYWTHPKKLQIQVDYMESHPECRICFHPATVINENGYSHMMAPPPDHIVNFENWLRYHLTYVTYMATATVLFRPPSIPIPQWYFELSFAGDWPLFVWLMLNGGTLECASNESMTVYRKHIGGATAIDADPYSRITKLNRDLHDYYVMLKVIDATLHKLLYHRFYQIYLSLCDNYLQVNDIKSSKKCIRLALQFSFPTRKLGVRYFLILFLKSHIPYANKLGFS